MIGQINARCSEVPDCASERIVGQQQGIHISARYRLPDVAHSRTAGPSIRSVSSAESRRSHYLWWRRGAGVRAGQAAVGRPAPAFPLGAFRTRRAGFANVHPDWRMTDCTGAAEAVGITLVP
jgi:hypothetical protein